MGTVEVSDIHLSGISKSYAKEPSIDVLIKQKKIAEENVKKYRNKINNGEEEDVDFASRLANTEARRAKELENEIIEKKREYIKNNPGSPSSEKYKKDLEQEYKKDLRALSESSNNYKKASDVEDDKFHENALGSEAGRKEYLSAKINKDIKKKEYLEKEKEFISKYPDSNVSKGIIQQRRSDEVQSSWVKYSKEKSKAEEYIKQSYQYPVDSAKRKELENKAVKSDERAKELQKTLKNKSESYIKDYPNSVRSNEFKKRFDFNKKTSSNKNNNKREVVKYNKSKGNNGLLKNKQNSDEKGGFWAGLKASSQGKSSSGSGKTGWGQKIAAMDVYFINFIKNIRKPLIFLIGMIAFIMGLGMVMKSINRMTKPGFKERGTASGTLAMLVIGSMLMSLPATVNTIENTLFGVDQVDMEDQQSWTTSDLSYVKKKDSEKADRILRAMNATFQYIRIFGLIAFIRGLFLFKVHVDGGQASVLAASLHMIGGVMAMNVAPVIRIFHQTMLSG
ncbi:MAG: hypothetical protein N4A43_02185 [Alphaproteobacteria bacterium]|nr:hypothetical protein [Alphaproteobacteria bacterium]